MINLLEVRANIQPYITSDLTSTFWQLMWQKYFCIICIYSVALILCQKEIFNNSYTNIFETKFKKYVINLLLFFWMSDTY